MPGSRFWWYRWSAPNGKRFAISLKTEDEATAVLEKAKVRATIERHGSDAYSPTQGRGEAPRPVDDVIDQYLDDAKNRTKKAMRPGTAKNIKLMLKLFCKDSGIHHRHELSVAKMADWIKAKKRAGRSTETLRSYSRDLRAWLRWLMNKGMLPASTRMLEMPDAPPVGRKNWLEQTKVDEIIEAAADDADLRFVLHAGFSAALRRNEISEARVEWFDLTNGRIDISSNPAFVTKDRDARIIPLKKAFREFLQTYLDGRTAGYVLAPDVTKGKSKYRFDSNRRLKSHFKNCSVKCSWHDMRRSFASNLLSKGESIYVVAKWLGDLVAVVERSYGHLAPAAGDIDR
ncbi:MAG TPA: site-specific integrase [Chthoniobacterales bacterium]|jgi:site-specific recombinase XerC|nr:site-specific integrase [Chthoniobacterales bacterium]